MSAAVICSTSMPSNASGFRLWRPQSHNSTGWRYDCRQRLSLIVHAIAGLFAAGELVGGLFFSQLSGWHGPGPAAGPALQSDTDNAHHPREGKLHGEAFH